LLHYLEVPLPELKARIVRRSRGSPPAAVVNPDELADWAETFEPPTLQELAD
jgi:hypothetical protein